ncbi:hypothetical protein HZH68_008456 [Vespula germanica]|uniref:Uncharacterized protein n=1 Tax=Vespula germanica TaxID=30212 RepID=A0A834N6Y9_VESGE|nr:hypothetical protein HZH68_008456 [Vespula germanica]
MHPSRDSVEEVRAGRIKAVYPSYPLAPEIRASFHSPWQSSDGVGIEASVGFGIESGGSDARDVNTVFIRNNEASRDA